MISQFARDTYAREIERQGPQWKPLAQSIRSGFSNLWVEPALKAIDAARQIGAQHGHDGPDSESD
jgi:hypothetical protein